MLEHIAMHTQPDTHDDALMPDASYCAAFRAVRILARGVKEMDDVRLALIFGSFASGGDDVRSDIDVLLVGDVD